jgi:hypothetical protein
MSNSSAISLLQGTSTRRRAAIAQIASLKRRYRDISSCYRPDEITASERLVGSLFMEVLTKDIARAVAEAEGAFRDEGDEGGVVAQQKRLLEEVLHPLCKDIKRFMAALAR